MQCPSCGFENLPGLQRCARCTSTLALAAVDVEPFRATDRGARIRYWQSRRRRLRPYLRTSLDKLVTNSLYSLRAVDGTSILRRGVAAVLSLIPGLGLVLLGRPKRGWVYFGVFFSCLLFSITFMGSMFGTFLYVVAAGIQTYSIAECIFFQAERFTRGTTIMAGLMIILMLYQGFYPAVGWVVRGLTTPAVLGGRIVDGPIAEGDVFLLTGRWFTPTKYAVGDLVIYNVGSIRGKNWQTGGGIYVDRIIGGPGDRVVCANKLLTLNGQSVPVGRGPLVNVYLPDFDITVPADMYFIFPSVPKLYGGEAVQDEARMSISLVAHGDIRGRVWMRVGPPHRIGRI